MLAFFLGLLSLAGFGAVAYRQIQQERQAAGLKLVMALPPLRSEPLPRAQDVPALPANAAGAEFVRLSWTRSSIVLQGLPDPYNQEYVKYIEAKERRSRDLNQIGDGAGGAVVALTGTVLGALAATGYGAVLVAVYELVNLIGQYLVPPSSGGWEKLEPLQRQRAILYQLHPAFEAQRNERPYPSQYIDLSIPDLGATGPKSDGLVPGIGSTGTTGPQVHDPRYPLYIRNQIIRQSYANHFFRVVNTHDEPCLPAVLINVLEKAKLWPPPIPPDKREYFGKPTAQWQFTPSTRGPVNHLDGIPLETDFDRQVYEIQYRQLQIQYELDMKKFAEVAGLADFSLGDIQEAEKNGSIPDLAFDPVAFSALREANAAALKTLGQPTKGR